MRLLSVFPLAVVIVFVVGAFFFSLMTLQEETPKTENSVNISEEVFRDWRTEATLILRTNGTLSNLLEKNELHREERILIPAGVTVIYDLPYSILIKALVVEGALVFAREKNTSLHVGTLAVYDGGTLDIAPASGVSTLLAFEDVLDPVQDPAQTSIGIVSVCPQKCTVRIEGTRVEHPFILVNAEQGKTKIIASETTDWNVGDELFLADTQTPSSEEDSTFYAFQVHDEQQRKFSQQGEYVRIVAIQGKEVTLDRTLSYTHRGYAALVSRNVQIVSRSEGARAHILFTGKTRAVVRFAELLNLGRTTTNTTDDTQFDDSGKLIHWGENQRGRYALHAHHLRVPFVFEGNSILGSPKWGIVNHDSFGIIRDNVVVGAEGGGIVGEDGTETGSIEPNLVIGTGGGSGEIDDERFGKSNGSDVAHGGFGYWFRGPFLEIRENVAAGYFKRAGFAFFLHPGFVPQHLPDIPGMPPELAGRREQDLNARHPLRAFKKNIADGTFGSAALVMEYSQPKHTVENFTVVSRGNSSAYGVYLNHINALLLKDSTFLGTRGTNQESIGVYAATPIGGVRVVNSTFKGYARESNFPLMQDDF